MILCPPPRSTLFPYTTLFRSGPDETWARFFRNGQGYIRTELVRDVADPRRFLTLDYWQSQSEFKRFREENRSEEHTSELQSLRHLVCRLLLEKKNITGYNTLI